MSRRAGGQTLALRPAAVVRGWSSVAGPMEGAGPLGERFDEVTPDDRLGERSVERAERRYMRRAVDLLLEKTGVEAGDVDVFLAGDLLDQLVTSSFTARELGLPYVGMYGACATSALLLGTGAALVSAGLVRRVIVATASHHLAAERQYRFPVELGVQRAPTAQWTATGGAAFLLEADGDGPRLTHFTLGRVQDMGLKDPGNMGGAMAPAAAHTLTAHFADSGRAPGDYDLILTGDLARVGHPLARKVLEEDGIELGERFEDAGILLYREDQDVHAGGSGTACSALVTAATLLPDLGAGRLRRALMVATGSLHSPTTYQQGESIPVIAHAVALEAAGHGK